MNAIDRHAYPDLIVKLAVELYLLTNYGFQKVSKLFSYLNVFFGLGLEKTPCANSIENWVKKSGYSIYHQSPTDFSEQEYAQIVDESTMLGSEKMLLTLGVSAEKTSSNTLRHSDIKVLRLSVSDKWNGEEVASHLEETEKKVGHPPLYSISDNDSKLRKVYPFIFVLMVGAISCHGSTTGSLTYKSLDKCNQVAKLIKVDNHQVVVCDLDLMKDTIVVPLSDLTETLHIVKLDGETEMMLPGTDVIVGDHHILVAGDYWIGKIPHKLFDKTGKFIANIGGLGKGPGEYRDVFAQQLDEKNNRIYLLPWRSDKILVYDLQGNYLDPIRLPYRIHIGRFWVNLSDSIVSVIVAPVNDPRLRTPATVHLAWSQDMSGKLIKGLSPKNFKAFDMSRFEANHPNSFGNTKEQDFHNFTGINPQQDTLYHYDIQNNQLIPQFTIDFKKKKIPTHIYCELPHHYIGRFSDQEQVQPGMFRPVNVKYFLIEKTTLKGAYIKLENDYLGNMDIAAIKDPVNSFWNGYYVDHYDPSYLFEGLEDALENNKMSSEMRNKVIDLKNSIKDTDNNYILYAKLKQ